MILTEKFRAQTPEFHMKDDRIAMQNRVNNSQCWVLVTEAHDEESIVQRESSPFMDAAR